MSPRDSIDRESPLRSRTKGDRDRALDSFVSESAVPATSFNDLPLQDALSDFPAEHIRATTPPAASRVDLPVRRKTFSVRYAAAAAAIMILASVGGWWAGLMSRTAPAQTAANAPAVMARAADDTETAVVEAPNDPVQSPPVDRESPPAAATVPERIVPDNGDRTRSTAPKPIALSGRAVEQRETSGLMSPARRTPPAREMSAPARESSAPPRGTSGDALTPPQSPEPVTRVEPRAQEPIATSPPIMAANLPARAPEPETPRPSASAPASPVSRVPDTVARPQPEALPSVVSRSEQTEIQRALGQYRNAYQSLDAQAARAVWPTVDVRALARAFDSLTSQELAFESCQFDIAGEAATAQCRGSATYTPKVGGRAPRLESREWTFQLRKIDETWKIQSAQTRR